ncbi:MAG TPA: hypothetical protein VG826_13820 [Pirellulales bacterium]|nr:hypothetical protein [Pirellulales bacterium]
MPTGTKPLPRGVPAHSNFGSAASRLRKALILRGEKFVLAGCVVGALVLCGLGFQRLPYGKSPADLKAEADKALADLEGGKPPAKQIKGLAKGPDLKALQSTVSTEIDRRAYAVSPLRIPVQNRNLRRGEPKVLPLQRLLASAGHGPIAIKGAVPTPTAATSTAAASPRAAGPEEKPLSDEQQRFQKLQEMRKKLAEERAKARGPSRTPKTTKKETKPVEEPVVVKTEPKEKPLLSETPAGSHLEERSWVCLVGVIPYTRQVDEYERAFDNALFQSAERDVPHYSLPQIERAEIVGGRRLPWRPVHVIGALVDHANWAVDYPEPVDPRLKDPDLTEPLPPLVLANYESASISHPQVKVDVIRKPKPVEPAGEEKAEEGASRAGEEKKKSPRIFRLSDKKPEAPAEGAGKTPDNQSTAAPEKPKEEPPEERIVNRLFRFFDFDVQPGKVYSYRIKLVAINPNYELPRRLLARPDAAQELFVEAKWSLPSPPVAVVRGTRLLASGIDYAENESSAPEPMAKILVRFFDFATSLQAFALFDATRGTVLNQAGVRVPLPEPEPPAEKRPGKPEKPPEAPTIDVNTDAVVLDLFGGDALAGRKDRKVPSHVLVVDRFGGFKTLLQANDAYTFEADLPAAQAAAAVTKPVSEQARK